MPEERFPILQRRALWEIGLPVALFWAGLLGQVLFGSLVVHAPGRGLDMLVYTAVLAVGGAGVWLLALRMTHTEVVISETGLALAVLGGIRWFMPWDKLAAWTWDWNWAGFPQGLLIVTRDGSPRRLQLGFLGVGQRIGRIVQPYPEYLPLLKALGYYLQGEPWKEPPAKSGAKPW